MKNLINARIASLAEKSVLKIPANYDTDVSHLLVDLQRQESLVRFVPLKRAVAMAAVFVFVFNVGVYATVHYVQERMDAMGSNEKSSYVENLQNAEVDVDKYSRPLTTEEMKKLERLRIDYESKAVVPEGELLQVDSEDEVQADRLCFVTATSTFYFPKRESTAEELLQFLDFYYKRDYSILDANMGQLTNQKVANVDAGYIVTAKEATQTASQLLEDIYGIVVTGDNYSAELKHYNAEIMDDMYWITFPQLGNAYLFAIDANSGGLKSLRYQSTASTTAELVVDQASYLEIYEKIKDLLSANLLKERDIENVYLEYLYDASSVLYHDTIQYYFELEDGSGYNITYNCKNQVIQSILSVENSTNLKQSLEKNAEYCQIHNLEQKILTIQ